MKCTTFRLCVWPTGYSELQALKCVQAADPAPSAVGDEPDYEDV